LALKDSLVEDALVGYLDEVAEFREVLASRFDDLKSGRVKAAARKSETSS
jgi:hypothetical protein